MTPPQGTPADPSTLAPPAYRWIALSIVMIGLFMAVLDVNIVNVALPHMMSAFSTNTDRIRWVVESYAITYAIFTLTTSWLRERFGIRNTFTFGLALFTLASALCGGAWDEGSMVFFRILQGIGGGIMMPTGFTIIAESFPPHQRGAAFGVFGLVIVVAPSIGPTFGGYLVDHVNWRYVFYINVPVGIITALLSAAFIRDFRKLAPKPFDFWGFLCLAVFLSTLLTALTEGQAEGWNSDFITTMFAMAAFSFAAFLLISMRVRFPILDLSLFASFFFSVIVFLNLIRSVALFGRNFLLPLFFQNLVGYSAMTTGLLLFPGAVTAGIVMPLTGPLVDRYGPKFFIFAGFFLFGVSNLMYYNLDMNTSYATILIPMIIAGIGAGMLNTPITSTAMNVVKPHQIGEVSTVLSVIMQVGGAFGIAVLGTLTTNRTAFHQALYAEKASPYAYATQAALESVKNLGLRIGESTHLIEQQAPALLGSSIIKRAVIAGYQDVFVITGLVCFAALIPALGLLRFKHKRAQRHGPASE